MTSNRGPRPERTASPITKHFRGIYCHSGNYIYIYITKPTYFLEPETTIDSGFLQIFSVPDFSLLGVSQVVMGLAAIYLQPIQQAFKTGRFFESVFCFGTNRPCGKKTGGAPTKLTLRILDPPMEGFEPV